MTAHARPAQPTPRRTLQLLTHSAPLRTALRRALSAAGSPYVMASDVADAAALRGRCDGGSDRSHSIVLDTELPGSHGSALLRNIVASHPGVPVYVVSPGSGRGHVAAGEAREAGAAGHFLKPDGEQPSAFKALAEAIVGALSQPKPKARPSDLRLSPVAGPQRSQRRSRRPQVLLIASSTGGPQALISLFAGLDPSRFAIPVLVVQHMPAAFTPILAQHLTRATRWTAREAVADERPPEGEIRIAPGGHHLTLRSDRAGKRLALTEEPPVNFCRPSADVLFVSAAQLYGSAVLAVILTGMGNDGCEGAKAVAAAGGTVIAQDEASSVVWGMPGAAVSAGVVHRVLPLDEIAGAVSAAVGVLA